MMNEEIRNSFCDLAYNKEYFNDVFDMFDNFIQNELGVTFSPSSGYRFIIGESQYPSHKNIVSTLGIAKYSNSVYSKEKIPEIAFLSQQYTCDLLLIAGVLFDSIDKGTVFVEWLYNLQQKNINVVIDFALYLFYRHKILLFNRYTKIGKLYQYRSALVATLLTKRQYQPSKILVVGKRTNTNFKKLVKTNSLCVVHPGSKNGLYRADEWCKTYFCRKNNIQQNSICLLDFKL